MKLKKALKRLEQKGTGMVLVMEEMSHNYNPEKYFNEIQTYGYLLRHTDDGIKPKPFRFMGFGEPYQYIDFLETEHSATDTEEASSLVAETTTSEELTDQTDTDTPAAEPAVAEETAVEEAESADQVATEVAPAVSTNT